MAKEKKINKSNDLSFEQHLDRAKDIITKLESGNCNLDELLSKYKDGIESLNFCSDKLNEFENKIKIIKDSSKIDMEELQ
ncbi:MAG: exodeoxyribonuclease VII small subunit [Candidatus Marinimicrobia bacterium]|nr:exodeoxyribonuclease VII small subunit [Candidatus Neomarinimicrobiota bacterium]|tara:strand:- start:5662 stop:5901 length:240 start_codon:yes stop_codon:yes gene_type:complete